MTGYTFDDGQFYYTNDGQGNYYGTASQGAAYVSAPGVSAFHVEPTLPTTGHSPVQEYTYSYFPIGEFNTPAGLLQTSWLADGLSQPATGSASYFTSLAVPQETYTYSTETAIIGGAVVTVYPMLTDTTYTQSDPISTWTPLSTQSNPTPLADTDSATTPTTQYFYTWYKDTLANAMTPLQQETVTTVSPAVPLYENGAGTAAQTIDWYDQEGQLVLSEVAAGYFTCNLYHPVTGLQTESIQDANTADAADRWEFHQSDLPVDATTHLPVDPNTGNPITFGPGGGQNLATDYSYDNQRRLVQTLGPAHEIVTADSGTASACSASWTVYEDAIHQTITAQGYENEETGEFVLVNPVSVEIDNLDGQITDYIQATVGVLESGGVQWSAAGSAASEVTFSLSGGTSPADVLATIGSFHPSSGYMNQSSYTAWTTYQYSHKQLVSECDYFLIPSTGTGSAGVNYDEMQYGYNANGRQDMTETPNGTYTWNVLDANGDVLSTWVGTNDTGATDMDPTGGAAGLAAGNNMVEVSSSAYDPDGDVTSTTAYVDSNPADDRTTSYGYNWRDEQVYVVNPAVSAGVTYTMTTYDNLGDATETQQYSYNGGDLGGALAAATADPPAPLDPAADVLLSQSSSAYDSLGQVYESTSYVVTDGEPGAIQTTAQTTNMWYDADGNQVALEDPEQNVTTWAYDGLDQATSSAQGQAIGAGTLTFNGLALADGQPRTLQVYVHLSTAALGDWPDYSASDAGGGASFSANDVAPSTGGWYDVGTLTLAAGDDSTSVTLNQQSGTVPDEVCLGYADSNVYDDAGELTETIDRDGRATTFQYNGIGEETSENWYSTDTFGSSTETISYVYNAAGLLQSATDQVGSNSANAATDSYSYDAAGDVLSETQTIPGLAPTVTLNETYSDGNRTQLAATIGAEGSANYDFVDNYQYDSLFGQMSQVTQQSFTGTVPTGDTADVVAPKSVTFGYDNAGEFFTISRYADLGQTELVAQSTYGYDNLGEITSLNYSDGQGNPLDDFAWTYDALGDVATSSSSLDANPVAYTTDSTGQVTGASGGAAPTESYSYDSNGNRETTDNANTGGSQVSCITGPNNELLFDGTYTYSYDANGNTTARWIASTTGSLETQPGTGDTDITTYTWDNRNRLTFGHHVRDLRGLPCRQSEPDGYVHLRRLQSLDRRDDRHDHRWRDDDHADAVRLRRQPDRHAIRRHGQRRFDRRRSEPSLPLGSGGRSTAGRRACDQRSESAGPSGLDIDRQPEHGSRSGDLRSNRQRGRGCHHDREPPSVFCLWAASQPN